MPLRSVPRVAQIVTATRVRNPQVRDQRCSASSLDEFIPPVRISSRSAGEIDRALIFGGNFRNRLISGRDNVWIEREGFVAVGKYFCNYSRTYNENCKMENRLKILGLGPYLFQSIGKMR